MAIQYVQSDQVIEVNGQSYAYPNNPNGVPKAIPCRCTIAATMWRIPVTQGNIVISYNYLVATDAIKPRADAVKMLRLKDTLDANTEYGIAIADNDGVTGWTFIDNCNGCCGDTPVMATVTIPTPILESEPQTTVAGTNTFVFALPNNPNALLYSIPFPWFNSVGPVTPYVPAGITTPALFVTWANTNWGDYGTWSSSGDIVTLVSAPGDTIYVTKAGVAPSLTLGAWCFDLTAFSTEAAVNGVKFGSSDTLFFAPFMLSNTNQTTLQNRLTPFMPFATFAAITNKLTINSLQAVPKLYNGATLVATATAGACTP